MQITCCICTDELLVATDGANADAIEHRHPCTLPCGHVFHNGCLRGWLRRNQIQTCPQCRARYSPETIIRLYPIVDESRTVEPDRPDQLVTIIALTADIHKLEQELHKKDGALSGNQLKIGNLQKLNKEQQQLADTKLVGWRKREVQWRKDMDALRQQAADATAKLDIAKRCVKEQKSVVKELEKKTLHTETTLAAAQKRANAEIDRLLEQVSKTNEDRDAAEKCATEGKTKNGVLQQQLWQAMFSLRIAENECERLRTM